MDANMQFYNLVLLDIFAVVPPPQTNGTEYTILHRVITVTYALCKQPSN